LAKIRRGDEGGAGGKIGVVEKCGKLCAWIKSNSSRGGGSYYQSGGFGVTRRRNFLVERKDKKSSDEGGV